MFPLKVQLVTVGLAKELCIPPPESAQFPPKVQLVTVGLAPDLLYIPPPLAFAEFPVNVQPKTAGLPVLLYIPPPNRAEWVHPKKGGDYAARWSGRVAQNVSHVRFSRWPISALMARAPLSLH